MNYTIKRGPLNVLTVRPEGKISRKIMAEEIVDMSFKLPQFTKLQIGDRVEVFGNTYFMATEPQVQKVSAREFVYTVQFTGIKYRLAEVQLLFPDSENELTVPDFSIMGTAETVLDLIIQNANRLQTGWTKGVVDQTETKLMTFGGHNCLTAVAKVAEEFGLEFWIDGDKSIHFTERKGVSGYTLEYGRAKGLRGLNRSPLSGANLITRLYATGSERNLPKNYRNGQTRLRMDVPFLEKNVLEYGIIEHTEKFEDVYPKRIGTVTAVDAASPFIFTDATLDFDLNEADSNGTKILIPKVPAKVIFQTGQLAGYRLEIRDHGYNTATKTFILNKNEDERALEIPNELMRPAVGDTYILEDIYMPAAYVTAAEAELKMKAQDYLDANSLQRFTYAAVADPIYFRAMNINMQLGNTVNLQDPDFLTNDDIRVVTIVQDLNDPHDVQFELADVATLTAITREYFEQENNQTIIQQGIKYNAEQARRSYQFAREFHDHVFDGEGYFDMENIKPLSIETKMLSLGSRLQQFGLPGIDFKLTNNTTLTYTAGKIVHQTINPDGLREWIIPANTVSGISTAFNNIYVKCQRVGNNASIIVTTQQIKVEQDPDFFHFEVGYLSSIIDGIRKIKTTYGFAQLNPAELAIGRISSPSGGNFIDLKPDGIDINGKVTFAAGSPAQTYVDGQVANATQAANNANTAAQNAQSSANAANAAVGNLNTYIDGAFADGLISETEAIAIEKYINTINAEKSAFDKQFTTLYANVFLTGTPKTNLNSAKTAYNTATTNLINSINTAIADKKVTPAEKTDVNNKFTAYNTAAGTLQQRIEEANSSIQTAINTNATNAQTAANNAQATANNAIGQITDIGSDNKLSPSEKQQTQVEWNRIQAEYAQYSGIASTLQVSATTYTSAYNTLNTYITPLLANLGITSDIIGNTFRANFTTYYTQFVQIVTDIENKKIENIQIGGANLLLKTGDPTSFLSKGGLTGFQIRKTNGDGIETPNGANGFYIFGGSGDQYTGYSAILKLKPNTEYTLSFDFSWGGTIASSSYYFLGDSPGATGTAYNIPYTQPKSLFNKVAIKFKTNSTNIYFKLRLGKTGATAYWLFFANFKLEEGNVATPWTPAWEDISAEIANVSAQSANALAQAQNAQNTAAALQQVTSFMQTTAQGNVIATGTLGVGDVNGGNAGITGATDRGTKSVRFWAGSDYAGKNMAGWLVRHDGVTERWFNGVLIEQAGVINGQWQNLKFNLDGVLAKKEAIVNGKIVEEWYNNGKLAYQIGQNGIYYVVEVPESYTEYWLLDLQSNTNTSDGSVFHQKLRWSMLQSEANPTRFILGGNKTSYFYSAGQNVYSEGNKQYEGYKNTRSKVDNIPDGWYAYSELGEMLHESIDGSKRIAVLIRVVNGKAIDQIVTAVETRGHVFITF